MNDILRRLVPGDIAPLPFTRNPCRRRLRDVGYPSERPLIIGSYCCEVRLMRGLPEWCEKNGHPSKIIIENPQCSQVRGRHCRFLIGDTNYRPICRQARARRLSVFRKPMMQREYCYDKRDQSKRVFKNIGSYGFCSSGEQSFRWSFGGACVCEDSGGG